ncbi:hypothetical protein F0330_12000 [Klebsiella pneumoniae]|nr:hypothetical protein F0330_12000 [Klebsiella pneumoniae]MBD0795253.1 hypothetical protein [Klebsiella sp. K4]
MDGFLEKMVKRRIHSFFMGMGYCIINHIFSMIAVSLFPDIAINLIGLFVLLIIGFHVVVWFKVKN